MRRRLDVIDIAKLIFAVVVIAVLAKLIWDEMALHKLLASHG